MLSYAFTTLRQGNYEDIAAEEFENMHNLFAAILAKGIGRQLKQGLYREYLNRKEDIAVVRGKIDMPGTIQNRLARKRRLLLPVPDAESRSSQRITSWKQPAGNCLSSPAQRPMSNYPLTFPQ